MGEWIGRTKTQQRYSGVCLLLLSLFTLFFSSTAATIFMVAMVTRLVLSLPFHRLQLPQIMETERRSDDGTEPHNRNGKASGTGSQVLTHRGRLHRP